MRNPVVASLTDGSKFVRVWLGVRRSTRAQHLDGSTDLRFAGERIGGLACVQHALPSGRLGRKMRLLLLQ